MFVFCRKLMILRETPSSDPLFFRIHILIKVALHHRSEQAQMSPRLRQNPWVSPRLGQNPRVSPRLGQNPRVSPRLGQNPRVSPKLGQNPRVSPELGQNSAKIRYNIYKRTLRPSLLCGPHPNHAPLHIFQQTTPLIIWMNLSRMSLLIRAF